MEVYAVDVGHGQLDWKLRNDERVHSMEKCNIRYVEEDDILALGEKPSFFSIDVSFISLTLVLPVVKKLGKLPSQVVCLIKGLSLRREESRWEKGRGTGHFRASEVIRKVLSFASSIGFSIQGLDFSPIKGPREISSTFAFGG